MNLLEVSDLSIKYKNITAVSCVSFYVKERDYLCIVGSNGSGKSSVLKGILGLVPIADGEIKFAMGKEEIGYLPQINNIMPKMPATAEEIVLTGTQKKGRRFPFYTKENKAVAQEKMALLEVCEFKKKRVGELSGGQIQRVLLARALCKNPKLLILDEPFTGLDEEITKNLYNILDKLNEKTAILMVSHDMNQVRKHGKSILHMDKLQFFFGEKEKWQYFVG